MSKIIKKFDPDVVRKAVNRIAEPVIQTLTPLGNNVLFEKDLFSLITNDGVTIAKLIDSEDEVEDSIIQMIKYGSLSTNAKAGDGTSTTILLTKKLVEIGLDKIEAGEKPMLIKQEFKELKDGIIDNAEKLVTEVKPKDWESVATISTSGDVALAKDVARIIETIGTDGMLFIDEAKSGKTKITEDTGYNIEDSMVDPVMGNLQPGQASYSNPHVFMTDKKLYHVEECKEILETGYASGARELVIVARDFLGESKEFFIANHLNKEVPLSILLVKYTTPDDDTTPIHDLATYLGATVVSEQQGNLQAALDSQHYTEVERVYSANKRTIFVSKIKESKELKKLIESVRKEKEADPDNDTLSRRLASLTTGTVKLEVGAPTGPEMRELMFRYDDAVNAVRAAIRSGYVTGGGMTLFNSTRELGDVADEFGQTSIRQIAHNCGVPFNLKEYKGDVGYNAKTGKFSNLAKDGVIEPYDVFYHTVANAFSIATAILTSGYYIVNKIDKDE